MKVGTGFPPCVDVECRHLHLSGATFIAIHSLRAAPAARAWLSVRWLEIDVDSCPLHRSCAAFIEIHSLLEEILRHEELTAHKSVLIAANSIRAVVHSS